jgi:PKD repeat protein
VGQAVQFSATATGSPLFYQWYFRGTNLPGATSSTLTLTNVTTNSTGIYTLTVTNLAGSVTSTATLGVYPKPPVVAIVSHTSLQCTVSLIGAPTCNYSLQASTNLVDWTDLITNASPFLFTDTNWISHEFYRGKYLP